MVQKVFYVPLISIDTFAAAQTEKQRMAIAELVIERGEIIKSRYI